MYMYKIVKKILTSSEYAYVLFDKLENKVLWANTSAIHSFADADGNIDLISMFSLCDLKMPQRAKMQMEMEGSAHFYDIIILDTAQNKRMCDIEIGYVSIEHEHLYIRIKIKVDKNLETIKYFVEHASRPVFLLNNDESFSMYYANSHFYQCIGISEFEFKKRFNNSFISFILSTKSNVLLENIISQLKNKQRCNMNVDLSMNGVKKWRCLDVNILEELDEMSNPINKFYGMIFNVDGFVADIEHVNQQRKYFEALQELSDDILFSIHIENKTLSHKGDKAEAFGLCETVENFPESIIESGSIHPTDVYEYYEYAKNMMKGNGGSHRARIKLADQSYQWFQIDSSILYDTQEKPVEVLGRLKNIHKQEEFRNRATLDLLTNTMNKISFQEKVDYVLRNASSKDRHAMLFLDIDDFKYVNDTFGHLFGDYLISQFGDRLSKHLNKHDLVGRVGGDEFILFIYDVSDNASLLDFAKDILNDLQKEFDNGQYKHRIKSSMGISIYGIDGYNFEELYKTADLALYESKRLGKDMATIYHEINKK